MANTATTGWFGAAPPAGEEALVGVEHEYSLRFGGESADFRRLIHSLRIPGRRMDPGDLNAYRLRSGMALTCDEAEAEVASPPLAVRRGFVREIERWTAFAGRELQAVLPPAYTIEGYSTHVSVSIPGDGLDLAALYAQSFGPSLALLMERPESMGIYVRPRPGRLELCGDFVDGARLGATAAFAAGSVRACVNAMADQRPRLPPPVEAQLLPAIERYGFRMLRTACGCDLYALGRLAPLPLADGRVLSAQEHLELAWSAARDALGKDLSSEDARHIDDMVAGVRPLGVETGQGASAVPADVVDRAFPARIPNEFGRIVDPIRRPGLVLETVAATWEFTLFLLATTSGTSTRYVLVPRPHLRRFVQLAERGDLDEPLRFQLASAPAERVLRSHAQTSAPGVYDTVEDLNALLAPERDPESGQLLFSGGLDRGAKAAARPFKAGERPSPSQPDRPLKIRVEGPAHQPSSPGVPPVASQPRPRSGMPVRGLLAVGAFAVAGAIALVVAMGGGEESSDGVPPTPAPSSEVAATPPVGASSPVSPVPTEAATATPRPVETARPSPVAIATATGSAATSTATPLPTPSPAFTPTVPPTIPGAATTTPAPPTATSTATATATATSTATPTATPTRIVEPTVRPTSTPVPVPTATPSPVPTRVPPATIIAATIPAPAPGCTPVPGTACP